METAKVNNLRLEDYIEYLLTVMSERLAADPDADIDELLLWADGIQKRFAMFGTGHKKRLPKCKESGFAQKLYNNWRISSMVYRK